MYHGLNNSFLYSAYRISCIFEDDIGKKKTVTGTAFFIVNGCGKMCLVTNRHLVDLNYKAKSSKYIKFALKQIVIRGKAKDRESGLPLDDQVLQINHDAIRFSDVYENDIACVIEPQGTILTDSLNATIDYHIPHNIIATKEDIETKISICDFVSFPGFPDWYDKRGARPIIRTGTISSDPRFDYSSSEEYQGECIAYEAFSYGGSSGSPIFAVQKGPKPGSGISFPGFRELKMIGINAGHLPAAMGTHSGISYMYKSSAILNIVDE